MLVVSQLFQLWQTLGLMLAEDEVQCPKPVGIDAYSETTHVECLVVLGLELYLIRVLFQEK